MNYNKSIVDLPISFCSQILTFIATLQNGQKQVLFNTIDSHFKKSKSYTQNAIQFLLSLGIIYCTDEKYFVEKTILKEINSDDKKSESFIKSQILKLKPFIQYCSFLNKSRPKLVSAKLVCNLYDIDKKPELIQKIFDKWCKVLGVIIDYNNINGIGLAESKTDFKHETQIRQHISNKLGNNFKKVNSNSIEDFFEAFNDHRRDAKKAINDIGRGLEDYLRLDFAPDLDLTKCNGITQISNTLTCNKRVHSKHNNILTAFASIRSMGDAHGVDKTSTERWTVNEETVLSYGNMTLELINSLIAYKESNSLKI